MDSDKADFDGVDDMDKNSFEKFVASKENDGYRDGLSAGTLNAFTEEFQAGLCSKVPIFVKLFQLHKLLSRSSSGYYKLDAAPQKFVEMIPALMKATESVTRSISSTSPTTSISSISQMSPSNTNTDVASLLSGQKLHEDSDLQTSSIHWVSLQKDLNSLHAFFENVKPSSYLESVEFCEMLNILKAFI